MPNLLTKIKLHEVSSVPRGAGEGVKVMLTKMAENDNAPSASKQVAIIMDKAIERGADADAVRKAAQALSVVVGSIEKNLGEADQVAAVEKSLSQCVDHLAGLVPKEKRDDFLAASAAIPTVKGDSTMTTEEKARFDALEKQNKDLMASVSQLTLKAAMDELSPAQKTYVEKRLKKADGTADADAISAFVKLTDAEKAKKLADDKAEEDREAGKVNKELEDQIASNPLLKDMKKQLDTALGKLSEFEKGDQVSAFAKRATDLGLPAEHGEVMRKAYGGDKDAIKKHEELLAGLIKQGATSALFKEFGNSDQRPIGGAYEEIRQKAAELQKALAAKGEQKSIQQCVAKVMGDPANAELVARNQTESLRKMGAIRSAA